MGAFFLLPPGIGLLRPIAIVDAAEKRDVVLSEANSEKQASQVLLSRDRLGEHYGFAAAAAVPSEVENHLDRILEGSRLGVMRQRSRARLMKSSTRASFRRERCTVDRRIRLLGRFFGFILFLKIPEHGEGGIVGTQAPL